jgi:hypothetical protein
MNRTCSESNGTTAAAAAAAAGAMDGAALGRVGRASGRPLWHTVQFLADMGLPAKVQTPHSHAAATKFKRKKKSSLVGYILAWVVTRP